MSTIMKGQRYASSRRGLPVSDTKSSMSILSVSSETVSFYYYSGTTRTADAGQAAGTLVEGKFAYSGILNAAGDRLGSKLDTSLSFASTAFTNQLACPQEIFEEQDDIPPALRLTNLNTWANTGAGFSQGDYVVDFRNGMIYGKKASTQTSLTSTAYKVPTPTNGNTGSSASQVQGNSAAAATDSGNPVKVGGVYNSSAPTYSSGQRTDLQADVNGNEKVVEQQSPVYEDNVNGKAVVEHRYSAGVATADTQIKATAGFVHTVSIAPLTATPTAGLLTIYDSAAESGTVVYKEWIFATTPGHTVTLDVSCATGIYVGFDATLANVHVAVSYR